MAQIEYSEEEVRQHLRAYVEEAGSQTEAAKGLGISTAYLSDILHGHRGISAEIAGKLGFVKKTFYYQKES